MVHCWCGLYGVLLVWVIWCTDGVLGVGYMVY